MAMWPPEAPRPVVSFLALASAPLNPHQQQMSRCLSMVLLQSTNSCTQTAWPKGGYCQPCGFNPNGFMVFVL
ncbi:uncharacterized [Tachysurus ichikawai]